MRGSGTTGETQSSKPAKPRSSTDSGRPTDDHMVPFHLQVRVRIGPTDRQTVTMAGNVSCLAK